MRLPFFLTKRWWKSWWSPPEGFPGIEETENWAYAYTSPRDDEEDLYSLALDYAEKRYEELVEVADALDKKLDELAKTSLAIGAIVATISRVAGVDMAVMKAPQMALAILCSVASVTLAVITRRPTRAMRPMNARTLLEAIDLPANLPKGKIQGATAASYHYAAIGMTAITEWKADQAKRATWIFCLGLVSAALMLFKTGPLTSTDSKSSIPNSSGTSSSAGDVPPHH